MILSVSSRGDPLIHQQRLSVVYFAVANMFIIPMGIACGAPFTFGHFLSTNLIPVTLGNIAGGALFCAAPYAFVFGGKSTPATPVPATQP